MCKWKDPRSERTGIFGTLAAIETINGARAVLVGLDGLEIYFYENAPFVVPRGRATSGVVIAC